MQITLHTEVEHESSEQSEQMEEADIDPKDRATSQSYHAQIHDCNFFIALCLRRLGKYEEAG